MASPCHVLVETLNLSEAKTAFKIAEEEAQRIESKFSRYLKNGIISQINNSNGSPVKVDAETAALLDFADSCFELSEGTFDVSSGVLRKLWRFEKGVFKLPTAAQAKSLLKFVGWEKVKWSNPYITLPKGMQIDLGGIGKEYAVDRVFLLLKESVKFSFLINFGGDIMVSGPRKSNKGWVVGVEDVNMTAESPLKIIELIKGALATSGNTKRFLAHDNKVYGHILNVKTGFPVEGAPRSITVAGKSCLDAGMLSTFSMLQGKNAEKFLKSAQAKYWIQN